MFVVGFLKLKINYNIRTHLLNKKLPDNLHFTYYLFVCAIHMLAIQQEHASVCSFLLSVGNNLVFLSSSVKKEEEDLEDKKSIKKRIKELKVLDPKIAQNLCKYLFPFSPLLLPRIGFIYCTRMCLRHVCHSNLHSSSQDTVQIFPLISHPKITSCIPLLFVLCLL